MTRPNRQIATAMPPIRVMIIEDSRVVREFLEHIIASDSRLEVAGAASTAEEGLKMLRKVNPDVISMDIRLPGMNGFDATRTIMSERPTPIVVVSASVNTEDLQITMNALKAGALAVVEKPVGTTHEDYQAMAQRLCTQLAIMSQVKVIRQRFNDRPTATERTNHKSQRLANHTSMSSSTIRDCSLVGIAASTGGPRALKLILESLPEDFPAPIAIVQHITVGFHAGFVRWLNSTCTLNVQTVEDGQQPLPGTVYIAPPDCHLVITHDGFRLHHGELVSSERPSGTVLFESMADCMGPSAIGVILTGMGEDGALGLARLHAAGGYTLAEDASSAIVYGMPAAAMNMGCVCESVPLEHIPFRLRHLTAAGAALRGVTS
jgi:two-component system chemotaxis response regulator CheB